MEGGKVGEKWHYYIIVSKVKENKQNAKAIQEVEKVSIHTLSTEVCADIGAIFGPCSEMMIKLFQILCLN